MELVLEINISAEVTAKMSIVSFEHDLLTQSLNRRRLQREGCTG